VHTVDKGPLLLLGAFVQKTALELFNGHKCGSNALALGDEHRFIGVFQIGEDLSKPIPDSERVDRLHMTILYTVGVDSKCIVLSRYLTHFLAEGAYALPNAVGVTAPRTESCVKQAVVVCNSQHERCEPYMCTGIRELREELGLDAARAHTSARCSFVSEIRQLYLPES
jgi:hypothetical protein